MMKSMLLNSRKQSKSFFIHCHQKITQKTTHKITQKMTKKI